jgi:hypothetical protein
MPPEKRPRQIHERVIDHAKETLERSFRTIDSAWKITIQAKEAVEKSKAHVAQMKRDSMKPRT